MGGLDVLQHKSLGNMQQLGAEVLRGMLRLGLGTKTRRAGHEAEVGERRRI